MTRIVELDTTRSQLRANFPKERSRNNRNEENIKMAELNEKRIREIVREEIKKHDQKIFDDFAPGPLMTSYITRRKPLQHNTSRTKKSRGLAK